MGDRATIDAALACIARGWCPVPVPHGSKGPVVPGWQKLRIAADDAERHFAGDGNIGVLLGEPSGWLVDVDLDCEEAREAADRFLPPTACVTGRASSKASHRWYVAHGARTRQLRDPVDRSMVVELRSTGAQTIIGPSVHPSGERYDMLEGIPATVGAEELEACVQRLADHVVARRHGIAEPVGQGGAADDEHVERRAIAYLGRMPPAISGSGGHAATYAAATALVHGFGIAPRRALELLGEHYNHRCEPPWSESELAHKVNDAERKPHSRPYGWLRDERKATELGVDLSGFKLGGTRDPLDAQPGDGPPDPGPFPEHLLRVPGFIADVMAHNLATAHRPQPVLALAGAITLQAVLAGRKVRDERGNRTNLYAVGVAPSGAGKDHARKVSKNVLFQAGLDALEANEDLASDAGLVSALEINQASLFQFDEFGRFLRTIGDAKKAPHLYNVLTVLMKLYSSADSVFKGKAYADAKRNKVIDRPCAVVYGTTVPEHFFESLTADALADGFMARLLVFEADSTAVRQRAHATAIPEPILEAARWWGDFAPGGDLRRTNPEPVVIPATPEAVAVYDRFAMMVDAELAKDAPGRSLWARAEEKACRLALVHACSVDREKPVVGQEAADWACAVSEHLTRRMLHLAHAWVSDGEFDSRQKRVLRVIRALEGKISAAELCRRTQWLTRRERAEVIENLLETGQILLRTESTATRPRRSYELP
jgi:hypothetical protein